MKKLPLRFLATVVCVAAACSLLGGRTGCTAAANGDIYRDSFTGNIAPPTTWKTGATGLNGRAPDAANLPGGRWSGEGSSLIKDVAWLGGDNSIKIALPASGGGFRKPAAFTISVDLNTATISRLDQQAYYRGMGVGFWDANGALFYGVVLHKEGTMTLLNGYDRIHPSGAVTVALTGDTSLFDWETWYRLSYEVDTSKGTVSNIKLTDIQTGKETPYTLAPGETAKLGFTEANTAMVGLFVNSSVGSTYGYFDNFRVY